MAATRHSVFLSSDGGNSWTHATVPAVVNSITDVAFDEHSNLFIASREGAYRSEDSGESWEHLKWLPVNHLASILFDDEDNRLIVTSTRSTEMFESRDSGRSWKRIDTGWLLREVRASRGRILATTAFDGVVARPETSGSARATVGLSSDRSQK